MNENRCDYFTTVIVTGLVSAISYSTAMADHGQDPTFRVGC